MIEVSEMYLAPQGEGPNLGRLSLFVRLHRCSLRCAWCDSKFTWNESDPAFGKYLVYESPKQLADAMLRTTGGGGLCHAVVLTGGEPLLWQSSLPEVLTLYRAEHPCPVEVETAGTLVPSDEMAQMCSFNISHKLVSSQNTHAAQEYLWNEAVVRRVIIAGALLLDNVCFKPVVDPACDDIQPYLQWLQGVGERVGVSWERLRERIYLMPQATIAEELAAAQGQVITLAQAYGVRCTTRMHILAFGNERRR